MRAPLSPVTIGKQVIVSHIDEIQTIKTIEWHTGYSQYLFNKGKDEFFESKISNFFDTNKNKWRKYKGHWA